MNRVILGALAAATLGAAPAMAADIPVKAPPMAPAWAWSGFYLGTNFGWIGEARDRATNTSTDNGGGGLGALQAVGAIPTNFALNNQGPASGVQAGFNWQSGAAVFGVEVDGDYINAKKSRFIGPLALPGFVPVTTFYRHTLDWLVTARARLGTTVFNNQMLVFVTGGFAAGGSKLDNQFICPACAPNPAGQASTFNESDSTRTGWTAGAGVEWKLTSNMSAKFDYLYVDLGRQNSTITYNYINIAAAASTSTLTTSVRNQYNLFRVGLNYQWGGPVVTRY